MIMALVLILQRSGTLSATEQMNLEQLISEIDSQEKELNINHPNS